MGRGRLILLFALSLAGCSSGGGGESAPSGTPPASNPASPPTEPPAPSPPPVMESPAPASALFVLGDSLSDVGNAAATADYLLNVVIEPPTVGLCNPYDVLVLERRCDDLFHEQSRVSDGAVAVEHLAARLRLPPLTPSLHLVPGRPGKGTVYAIASAKARGPGDVDLARQVDWLLLDRAPLRADALFVIMIGGNDAIDALQADLGDLGADPRPSAAIVTAAVAAIGAAVERLLDFGARRLIVANVPDLATLPAVRAAAQASGDELATLAAASSISVAFDRALHSRLNDLEARGQWLAPTPPAIDRFDLRAALKTVREEMAAGGGNTADACFDSETYRSSGTAERAFHPGCVPPADGEPDFSAFVFWDGIHPSGASHAALGAALLSAYL